jgi:CheY-like chemotaxis protein
MTAAWVLEGATILVLEDDLSFREGLAAALHRFGARVLEAGSAQAALHVVQERRPDIMVVDLGLPSVDGIEFLRRVHRLPARAGGQTPAVALTARNTALDRAATQKAGFIAHLTKPIQLDELARVLGSVLSIRRRS